MSANFMQSQLQNTKISLDYQESFSKISKIVLPLYNEYVPIEIKNRRNINQQIQPDYVIISAVIWATMQGFSTQIAQYKAICSILCPNTFPERSRYYRICGLLVNVIKIIRVKYVKSLHDNSPFSILDSMPIPLCTPIRNNRAKLFKEVANIGFNATKNSHFYGLKLSLLIDHKGFPKAYSVTSASTHDIHMASEVVEQAPTPQVLADKGYVSKKLKDKLAESNINFWTPRKKNSKQPKVAEDKLLGKLRKQIETVFSSLIKLSGNGFRSRSLLGFEAKLEIILLTYTLLLAEAQKIIPGTLKYSLGYF